MTNLSPTPRHQGLLGPGLEAAEIGAALAQLGQDPEISKVVLFGSRARGTARRDSDLDLLISDAATTSRWTGSQPGSELRPGKLGFLAQHCVVNLLEGLIVLAYLAGFLGLCGRSV